MKIYNKFYKIIAVLTLSYILTSCYSVRTNRVMQSRPFQADRVEIHLTMDDFELLGDFESEYTYKRYFGIFTIDNEEDRVTQSLVFTGKKFIYTSGRLSRSLYEGHLKYPTADFFVPVYVETERTQLFLGAIIKQKAKFKAYKLK